MSSVYCYHKYQHCSLCVPSIPCFDKANAAYRMVFLAPFLFLSLDLELFYLGCMKELHILQTELLQQYAMK